MPQITRWKVLDLSYEDEAGWEATLTRAEAQGWTVAGFLPVNASRAKALVKRTENVPQDELDILAAEPPKALPPAVNEGTEAGTPVG